MLSRNNINLTNALIAGYFIIAFVDILAEYFLLQPVCIFSRVVTPLLLIWLYKINSEKPNPLVYTLFLLVMVTNFLFFYKDSTYFFLTVLISILQRAIMLFVVFRLAAHRKLLTIVLASIPFLIIFYYLNSITGEFAIVEYNTLFFQSILVSLLGGISLAGYLHNDNRQNSWLLISTLLFIGLQFVVFIERYFFSIISLRVFGLIGTVLSLFGYFTFYKFVIAAEKHDKNHL